MATTVVNKRKDTYDTYIGRGSALGNPFVLGTDGDRATVIARYAAMIAQRPDLIARARTLRGKRLGCFCAPLACHGDVIAWYAEGRDATEANPWLD